MGLLLYFCLLLVEYIFFSQIIKTIHMQNALCVRLRLCISREISTGYIQDGFKRAVVKFVIKHFFSLLSIYNLYSSMQNKNFL